ncbi:hypothetical protein [Streptomyces sp. NPDC046862]|uniref:hypothetical protein n=1 Tax=Streptomyces sp. NPDC046862 TaxID=3154603 RepID=UPI0034568827
MDLNRTPAQIANAAADEIRTLNHRTIDRKAFEQPGDVAATVEALTRLVQGLPQSLQQLEAGLNKLHDDQRIRLDDLPPEAVSQQEMRRRVVTVTSALQEARVTLSRLDHQLKWAVAPLSHMGGLWEGDEDE